MGDQHCALLTGQEEQDYKREIGAAACIRTHISPWIESVELELELELEASKLKTNALQPSLLASQGIFASDGQAKRFINNGDDGECVGRRLGAELKTLLLPCVLLPTNFDQKVKPHYVLLLLSATVALLYYLHNIYACNFWFQL